MRRQRTLTPGRASWIVGVCLVLLAKSAAAAEPSLAIDFDSDGQHDTVMLSRGQPSVLHVWLSASDTTQVIHTRAPLLRIAAADFNGDHVPDLIASDSALRIHVWTRKRSGFHTYRPHTAGPRRLNPLNRHRVDDDDRQSADVLAGPTFALALCASPRAPAIETTGAAACYAAREYGFSTATNPFAPRPPPAHHLPL
jgi:hypothetical protein